MSEQLKEPTPLSFGELNAVFSSQIGFICASIVFHQNLSQLLPEEPDHEYACVIAPKPKQPDLSLAACNSTADKEQLFGSIDFNYRFNTDSLNPDNGNTNRQSQPIQASGWGEPRENEGEHDGENEKNPEVEYISWDTSVKPVEVSTEEEEVPPEKIFEEEDPDARLFEDQDIEPIDVEQALTELGLMAAPIVAGELAGDAVTASLISLYVEPITATIVGEVVGEIVSEQVTELVESVRKEAEEVAAEKAITEAEIAAEAEEYLNDIIIDNGFETLAEFAAEFKLEPADLEKMSVTEIESTLETRFAEIEKEQQIFDTETYLIEIADNNGITLDQLLTVLEVESVAEAMKCRDDVLSGHLNNWVYQQAYSEKFKETYLENGIIEAQLLQIMGVSTVQQACQLGEAFLEERVSEWRLEVALVRENMEAEKEFEDWEYSIRNLDLTNPEVLETIINKLKRECEPLRAEFKIKKTQALARIATEFATNMITERERDQQLAEWNSDGNFAICHAKIRDMEPLSFKAFSNYRIFGGNDNRFAGSENPGEGFSFVSEMAIDGRGQNRHNLYDTERAIINALDAELKGNTSAKGEIIIYTELAPCAGCEQTRVNIRNRYPGIVVSFIDQKGAINRGSTYEIKGPERLI
jgi:hypothetical protein